MFDNIAIKRELEEESDGKGYRQNDYSFVGFNDNTIQLIDKYLLNDVLSSDVRPKKAIKFEIKSKKESKILTESHSRIVQKLNSESNECKYFQQKSESIQVFNSTKNTSFDFVLQELFSWNPEWLQGRALTKPPLQKFEQTLAKDVIKYTFTREEFIARYLPYIQSRLFIRLSDAFKNEAPSRLHSYVYISECENSGDLDINKRLVCYSLRDIRKNTKPIARPNDICIITLDVMQTSCEQIAHKQYFGLIKSHSLIELSELEPQLLGWFDNHLRVDSVSRAYLLWDKLIIATKRSRESCILSHRMSKLEVVISGTQELRQIQNLLFREWKYKKLLTNIFNANANIHQFSTEELIDVVRVRKTLVQNTLDMITKSNPMVFFKGVNGLMVVDISDEEQRFNFMCDIINDVIESKAMDSENVRFLVITPTNDKAIAYKEELKKLSGFKSPVKSWSLIGGRGWTRYEEVCRFSKNSALLINQSLTQKLKNLNKNQKTLENELRDRKTIYNKLINSFQPSYKRLMLMPDAHIAREDLLNKGYESVLNDHNVIIGTIDNIINCQPLVNDRSKPFDCCIVDDSHTIPDPNIFSIIHLNIQSMIIGGDSESTARSPDTSSVDHNFSISLFSRILKKHI